MRNGLSDLVDLVVLCAEKGRNLANTAANFDGDRLSPFLEEDDCFGEPEPILVLGLGSLGLKEAILLWETKRNDLGAQKRAARGFQSFAS